MRRYVPLGTPPGARPSPCVITEGAPTDGNCQGLSAFARTAEHARSARPRSVVGRRSLAWRVNFQPSPCRSTKPSERSSYSLATASSVVVRAPRGDALGERRRPRAGRAASTRRGGGVQQVARQHRPAPVRGQLAHVTRPVPPTSAASRDQHRVPAQQFVHPGREPAGGRARYPHRVPARGAAAARAVTRAPLRYAASTTTVPRVNAAMTLLRRMNLLGVGWSPGGNSPTTSPCSAMRVISCVCPRG